MKMVEQVSINRNIDKVIIRNIEVIMIMVMMVVVQVLSNMNVAELVDFVKVSSTNGELPDGHRLMMMMMMMMIRIRIILMMMMIVIMKASQQILTSHEDHNHDLDNDSIQDDEDAQTVVQCPMYCAQYPISNSNVHNVHGQSDRCND